MVTIFPKTIMDKYELISYCWEELERFFFFFLNQGREMLIGKERRLFMAFKELKPENVGAMWGTGIIL
jgi:hypothetical protein